MTHLKRKENFIFDTENRGKSEIIGKYKFFFFFAISYWKEKEVRASPTALHIPYKMLEGFTLMVMKNLVCMYSNYMKAKA